MRGLLFIVIFVLLTSCAAPTQGFFYSNTTSPHGDKVALDAQTLYRLGVSRCHNILLLFTWGDCSIRTARKNGKITSIHNIEQGNTNYYFAYIRYEIKV